MNDSIFSITTNDEFDRHALATFRYQAEHVPIYAQYLRLIGRDPSSIKHYSEIPFLPIEFFKTQQVIAKDHQPEIIFTSSGTTGMISSQHLLANLDVYKSSFRTAFRQFYGEVRDIVVLALLPSYLERTGSSLIYMVDDLISQSSHPESGYFLYNFEELHEQLLLLKMSKKKTLLIGVTYALLDFIEQYQMDFPELIVMETGGMKGKRKEMIREELHKELTQGFGVQVIHSEYGMTELLSQAYSDGNGLFRAPNWMKVLLRDTNDPLSLLEDPKKSGAINVIDLANYYSCAFIATQDLGKLHPDNTFEILGRFDQADIRGCNLLVQ